MTVDCMTCLVAMTKGHVPTHQGTHRDKNNVTHATNRHPSYGAFQAVICTARGDGRLTLVPLHPYLARRRTAMEDNDFVVVDASGVVHDLAHWTHVSCSDGTLVWQRKGRDVDCMTCLVRKAREGAR